MSKGLAALERYTFFPTTDDFETIKKELKDGAKYKKAIEILKGKGTYMVEIISAVCYYKTYDDLLGDACPWCSNRDLNREEFDLLKEVFK